MRAYSAKINDKIPSFIREDYPALTEFIETYYQWIYENYIKNVDLSVAMDLDETPESFLKYFVDEIAKGMIDEPKADLRTILKNIDDLFKSKGNEQAIRYVMRVLFNEDVDVFYPGELIFETSASTWIQKYAILIDDDGYGAEYFQGKNFEIQYGGGYIERAMVYDGGVRLFVSDISGNFETQTQIFVDDIGFDIFPQVVSVDVITPGTGFNVGEIFTVGDDITFSILETTSGPITSVTILDGGSSYTLNDTLEFYQLGPLGRTNGEGLKANITEITAGVITGIEILDGGTAYNLPPLALVNSTTGSGADILFTGNIGGIKYVQMISGGMNLSGTEEFTIRDSVVRTRLGNIVKLQGNFSDSVGMSSTKNATLQDEHYYQYFSYVVRSALNYKDYGEIFKKFLHPTGMKLFSELSLNELVKAADLDASSTFELRMMQFMDATMKLKIGLIRTLTMKEADSRFLYKERLDLHKDWFNESTYILNFDDQLVSDWSEGSKQYTQMQPDAVVIIS